MSQGERGEKGDPGMNGEQGEQGEQGIQGLRGAIGQIGLRGNQGNQGFEGSEGQHGEQGETGETGKTGPAGADAPSATRRLLVMFIVMVFAFTVLAIRTEINQHAIKAAAAKSEHAAAVLRYDGCLSGVQILGKFNTLFQRLAEVSIDAMNADPSPDPVTTAARRHYIRIYTAAIVALPDNPCGDDPRGDG